jgi:hypothetical protein
MNTKYALRQSTFFDPVVFEETNKLMASYYKLEPQLALLTKRTLSKL